MMGIQSDSIVVDAAFGYAKSPPSHPKRSVPFESTAKVRESAWAAEPLKVLSLVIYDHAVT